MLDFFVYPFLSSKYGRHEYSTLSEVTLDLLVAVSWFTCWDQTGKLAVIIKCENKLFSQNGTRFF